MKQTSWKSAFYLHIFSLKYGCCHVTLSAAISLQANFEVHAGTITPTLVQVACKCEQVNRCVECQEEVIFKIVWKD